MKISPKILSLVFLTLLLFGVTACANYDGAPPTASAYFTLTPVEPAATITPTILNTTTPILTNTLTATPGPDISPNCKTVSEEGKLYILSDDIFFALGPTSEEIDQALADNFTEWANYEQDVRWDTEPAKLGEIVREASFQEKFALNSAVTLITLGESLEWQLPSDSDLFLQSLTIGERLVRFWDEYSHPDHESIRSSYSEVTNGASYALYVFFDYNTDRLQAWCNTYQQLFGTSP